MNKVIRVILVGRHTPAEMPEDIEVVEQRNILWSLDRAECYKQLAELITSAANTGVSVLFQNIPGTLAVAIANHVWERGHQSGVSAPYIHADCAIGVVISIPGERKAGEVKSLGFTENHDAYDAEELVKFANGRAKTERNGSLLTVTVDPVSEFVFSHIEWF